jgi:hypothetical protein
MVSPVADSPGGAAAPQLYRAGIGNHPAAECCHFRHGCAERQAGSAAKKTRGSSETAAVLAGAIDPKHDHVAGGLVAACIGIHAIQCPVTAGTGQLAHARMLAHRVEAGVLL